MLWLTPKNVVYIGFCWSIGSIDSKPAKLLEQLGGLGARFMALTKHYCSWDVASLDGYKAALGYKISTIS